MKASKRSHVRIAVDIGGTFTDGVAELAPDGRIWVAKCLTTPDDPGRAVGEVTIDLLRQIERSLGEAKSAGRVTEVVHGTTLVTNTIIERKGAKVGLFLTEGTKDALDIAREIRYDLYDLELELPKALVPPEDRFELSERMDAQGRVLRPLDDGQLDRLLGNLKSNGVQAVAVCLLHAYVNDDHERRIGDAIRKRFPDAAVSLSSAVAREIREFERMSTTVANAYVQPLMGRYLRQLEGRLKDIGISGPLRIMVSSGGFMSSKSAAEIPILLLESGPAGGVLSALNTAAGAGIRDTLTFDMGGTTAKACVTVDGRPSLTYSFETARVRRFKRGSGLPILTPSIDLIEIGAGGGSIARVSPLGLLNVGPESSGAVPGPACYGQGGDDATVTDADLVLGYLDADHFLGGEMKLNKDLALKALARLGDRLGIDRGDVARGIFDIVNENMAGAARVHIAEKGYDPRTFTLVATGGAGPVHAVEVAAKLRIKHIICTIAAGAGSCLGLLAAPARVDRSWSRVELLERVDWAEVRERAAALRKEMSAELGSAGARGERIEWTLGADIRYEGQGNTVVVGIPHRAIGPATEKALVKEFTKRYVQLYGQAVPNAVPEVVTWRLTGRSDAKLRRFRWAEQKSASRKVQPLGKRAAYLPAQGRYGQVPVYERYALPPKSKIKGPAILQERESTLVVARSATISILEDLTVSIKLP